MLKKIALSITLIAGMFLGSSAYAKSCASGSIIGALIGGAIGNHIRKDDNNRDTATGIGALLGGAIGSDNCQRNNQNDQYIEMAQPVRQPVQYIEVAQPVQYIEVPQPVYTQPSYIYPGNLYKSSHCQVVAHVAHDGFGGYYTQWQNICN